MKRKSFIKIKRVGVLMSAIMLLFCSACVNKSISKSQYNATEIEIFQQTSVDDMIHTTNETNLELIAKSGLLELYFDSTSFSVAIKETSKDKLWYSLPTSGTNNESGILPSVLQLKVENGNKTLYLNSQDNSVIYGTASYEKTETGLDVSYIVAKDKESAIKAKDNGIKDDVVIIKVSYRLENGSFFSSIDCSGVTSGENLKVTEISFNKYFGAFQTSNQDDFLLVPDGSGAIIKPYVEDASFTPIEIPVYGSDYSTDKTNKNYATAALFGIKQENSAFAAIVQKGEAISKICADRSEGES